MNLHVVYHTAQLGNWQEVVTEQFAMLKEVGLSEVHATHVGKGSDWLKDEALRQGINLNLVSVESSLRKYEAAAMLHIEQFVKTSDDPVMYLHTKGVSKPESVAKKKWRAVMEKLVVRPWEKNLFFLDSFDCVGFNWQWLKRPHFSGNFWIAKASWLRQLPEFKRYHRHGGGRRYSCEFWIGSGPNCKPASLACSSQPTWLEDFNFDQFLDDPHTADKFTGPR